MHVNTPLCWYALCIATLLSCLGCEIERRRESLPPTTETHITDSQENAAAVASQAVAVHALEAAGAKLQRNSRNLVSEVLLLDTPVTDELAQQIAQLDSVEKLTFNDSVMTLGGWQSLARLSAVQQLDLRDCPVDNEQLAASVSGMPRLKALRMSGKSGRTTVDDAGLIVLKNCPELKALSIDGLWVTVDGIRHLRSNKSLAELYAGGTALDDDALAILAELPNLRKLRLSQTVVGTPGLEALSRLPIEDLDISECSGVTDETLAIIAQMQTLKRLNLWRDTIGDEGVFHLAGLTKLEWLNLDNTHLTDTGLPHLSGLTKLTFLHLGSTGVTDDGMPALISLRALKDLKVTRTAVTEQGVEDLKRAIPSLEVQIKYIDNE